MCFQSTASGVSKVDADETFAVLPSAGDPISPPAGRTSQRDTGESAAMCSRSFTRDRQKIGQRTYEHAVLSDGYDGSRRSCASQYLTDYFCAVFGGLVRNETVMLLGNGCSTRAQQQETLVGAAQQLSSSQRPSLEKQPLSGRI